MSAFIGDLPNGIGVWTSRAGVEIADDKEHTITPIEARNLAALLVRAADECERMRTKPDGGMCDFALPDFASPNAKLQALLNAVRDAEEYRTPASRAVVVEAAIAFARSQRNQRL